MTYKVYAAFIMSLGIALGSSQAVGGSGVAHGGVVAASPHSTFRPSVARLPGHHKGRNFGAFFPVVGDYFGDSSYGSYGQPNLGVAPPMSGDITYTYKYDVPWDWAHRFPPGFFDAPAKPPSPPVAFVPGCPAQTVKVLGSDGKDQTVTVVRC